MKNKTCRRAAVVGALCAVVFAEGNAVAAGAGSGTQPTGVPVDEPGPLECETKNFVVTAITGENDEFPLPVPCGDAGQCSEYGYLVTAKNPAKPDHAIFAVSATHELYATTPSASVAAPGAGDSVTGFLKYAWHEYPVRFNSSSTVNEGRIVIVGTSSPRVSTALIKGGSKRESCLIAGPGNPTNEFQPVAKAETAVVAGGKCEITKHFDAAGNLVNITSAAGSSCIVAVVEGDLLVNDEPLQYNPDGITFGNGTSTCYGPPVPRTPICVCTAAPCP